MPLSPAVVEARVVSMPSWELFELYCREHPDYREQVLPDAVTARVSVEQGATLGWARYVGRHGHSIGMETFGASAPLKELQKKFGFVPGNIIEAARAQIARARRGSHGRGHRLGSCGLRVEGGRLIHALGLWRPRVHYWADGSGRSALGK
jgi:hypothetical protein